MNTPQIADATLRDTSPPAGEMVNVLVVGSLLCVLLLVGMVCGFIAGLFKLLGSEPESQFQESVLWRKMTAHREALDAKALAKRR